MMNISLWDNLSDEEKIKFGDSINTLLTKTYVLERKYSNSENKPIINSKYRFIQYNESLVRDYLSMIGWELIDDNFNGVYMVQNEQFNNYINLGKIATIFLLVLRLIYEEAQETASANRDVIIKLSDILNKIEIFKLMQKNPSYTDCKQALIKLKKFEIIDKITGDYDSPDSRYIVYPSIIYCINEKNIQGIMNSFLDIKENEDVEEGEEDEVNN